MTTEKSAALCQTLDFSRARSGAEVHRIARDLQRLKVLEIRGRDAYNRLSTIQYKWEDLKKKLQDAGEADIDYDWGDVLA
jgi:hypothetical protein